jgi:hypothetical protein
VSRSFASKWSNAAVFLQERAVHQAAGASGAECVHLCVADDEFVLVQIEVGIGIDGHREDEVLRLLVVATEPGHPGDFRHARDGADLLHVGEGQLQRNRILVGGDEFVGAGASPIRVGERVVHGFQDAEQQEGDDHRQQRKEGAGFLAPQRGPDEREVFHDATR